LDCNKSLPVSAIGALQRGGTIGSFCSAERATALEAISTLEFGGRSPVD
jgi:hypothetical protein